MSIIAKVKSALAVALLLAFVQPAFADLASDKAIAVFDTEAVTPGKIEINTLVSAGAGDAEKTAATMTAARLKLSDEMHADLRTRIQANLKPLGKANVYEDPAAVD